jgi:hypothetical protein
MRTQAEIKSEKTFFEERINELFQADDITEGTYQNIHRLQVVIYTLEWVLGKNNGYNFEGNC